MIGTVFCIINYILTGGCHIQFERSIFSIGGTRGKVSQIPLSKSVLEMRSKSPLVVFHGGKVLTTDLLLDWAEDNKIENTGKENKKILKFQIKKNAQI